MRRSSAPPVALSALSRTPPVGYGARQTIAMKIFSESNENLLQRRAGALRRSGENTRYVYVLDITTNVTGGRSAAG
jgi:hypothetical protein